MSDTHRIILVFGVMIAAIVLLGSTLVINNQGGGGGGGNPGGTGNAAQYRVNATTFGGSVACEFNATSGFLECTCDPATTNCDQIYALETDAVSEPLTAGQCHWNVFSDGATQSKLCWFCNGGQRYCSSGAATSEVTSGDVAEYELNESSGTNAPDTGSKTCGAGNCDGTLTNFADPPTAWTGSGLTFDGTNDYIVITGSGVADHALDFVLGDPFSIAVRYVTPATVDNDGTLVAKRDGADIQFQLHFQGGNQLVFRSGSEVGYISITALASSTTYTTIVTVDETGFPRLYDPVACTEGTWVDDTGTRPFALPHETVEVTVGARLNVAPASANNLEGEFKWIKVFDRVLSPEDVTAACALAD